MIPTFPSWEMDFQRRFIYKQTIKKTLHRFDATQKDHILSHNWMKHKHEQYNSRINECSYVICQGYENQNINNSNKNNKTNN